jgi:hypothetical protein
MVARPLFTPPATPRQPRSPAAVKRTASPSRADRTRLWSLGSSRWMTWALESRSRGSHRSSAKTRG